MDDNKKIKNKHIIYSVLNIAGELLLFLFMGMVIKLSINDLDLVWLKDEFAAFIIFSAILLLLLITGLIPDFLRSFVYCFTYKENISVVQLKRSIFSVKLAMFTALIVQFFISVLYFISFMAELNTFDGEVMTYITVVFAEIGAQFICSIAIILLLFPIYVRLKMKFYNTTD